MPIKKFKIFLLFLAVIIGMAAALEICNMDAEDLATCLPAIRVGVNPSTAPSDACCAVIRRADLPCLCGYKDSYILRAAGVDPKLAVTLPAKCHLKPPPECNGVEY